MASFSSSCTKKISPASAYTLKLTWSGEQDIVTNTSTITVIGTVSRNGTSYKAKNLNGGFTACECDCNDKAITILKGAKTIITAKIRII